MACGSSSTRLDQDDSTSETQNPITNVPQKARWPGLVFQAEPSLISEDQLTAEIKGIYAGLVVVEAKCINIDGAQASNPTVLSKEQWQALIALHRALLYEHHDFLMATQHPSATSGPKELPAKYSMPARLRKHGIHAFLEILRHRRPDSQDYMLSFIYVAYQMTSLLHETVPVFLDTWFDCLGDLARYRTAIEEERKPYLQWGAVAASWYLKASPSNLADHNPRKLSWTSYECPTEQPGIKQWYETEAAELALIERSLDRTTHTQRPLGEVKMMRLIRGPQSRKRSKLRSPSTKILNSEVQPCAHGSDKIYGEDFKIPRNFMRPWLVGGADQVAAINQRFRFPTPTWTPSSLPRLMYMLAARRRSMASRICKALTSVSTSTNAVSCLMAVSQCLLKVSAMQAVPAEHRPTFDERYGNPGGLDGIVGSLPYILLFLLALAFEALTVREWLHERFTLFNLFEAVLTIVAWPALVRTGNEAQSVTPFLQATILAIWFLMICAGARSLKFRSPQAFGIVAIVIGGMAYVAINLLDTPDASEHGAKRVRMIQAVKLYEHALVWLITMTIYGIFKIFICLSRRKKTRAKRTTRSPNFPV
ncbi:hypothetical protein LTS14_007450 [Recurvomyces mirabilis]|uniref:uncharacterized protein n=1 Tax=Recurvomyces mirabilis TaxID=574656 RepID=UPI002DDF6071|nr:hypothetical protein LTS14_007450 [Recurvomyces mirabilis]